MTENDRMRGQLESLEVVYDHITERPLIEHQDGPNYRFSDGAEAHGLPDAVQQGTALVRFAMNQLKQNTAE